MSADWSDVWSDGTLGDFLPLKYGKSLPERLRDESGNVPVYGSSGRVGVHSAALTKGPALIVGRKGCVGSVFLSDGPCWPIDTVYFAEGFPGQNLRYFKYLLDSLRLVELDKSTAIPGLSRDDYNAVPTSVAPLYKQREIVAEIEKQFSRLDEAVANLQRVKANLARYAAGVRAQAIQGALDSHAGALNGGELPVGWRCATIGEVAKVGTGATPSRGNASYYDDGTIPWVTSAAVNNPFVDRADQFVTPLALSKTNLTLYPPGTLLVAMYGEGKTRGKCTELRISATTNQALAAIQVDPELRDWLKLFLDHNYEGTRRIASGGVQPNLNLSLIRSIRVPIPPTAEQHRIVAEVDRRLSIVREVEAEVDANLKRAQALRQAVLARAFSVGVKNQPLPSEAAAPRRLIPGTTSLVQSARAALSAEIVHRLHDQPGFGRVKHQKVFHLCEHIAQLQQLETRYRRARHGPVDLDALNDNERILEQQRWYAERQEAGDTRHRYLPLTQAGGHKAYLDVFSAEQLATIRRLIDLMRDWDTGRCERFSTVYAAWNDLVLLNRPITPDAIVDEVLLLWHDDKQRVSREEWKKQVDWIERNGFVPTGFGHPTRSATDGVPRDLFGEAEST